MATAKKKVAPTKVRQVKAAPAKKAAAKRVYRRKPVVDPEVTTVTQEEIVGSASMQSLTEALADVAKLLGGEDQQTGDGLVSEEQAEIHFLNTEFIDLREMNAGSRFSVVTNLESLGYVFAHHPLVPATELHHDFMNTDGLGLNHKNKLITLAEFSEFVGNRAVSKPEEVCVKTRLLMTPPGPVYPDTVEINGQTYVKAN